MKLPKSINTITQAKAFIELLQTNQKLYHLDDSPLDIIGRNGRKLFTYQESKQIDRLVDDMGRTDNFDIHLYCLLLAFPKTVSKLDIAMMNAEFVHISTGGGCTGYAHILKDGWQLLITVCDGCDAPVKLTDKVCIGLETDEGEYIGYIEGKLSELLKHSPKQLVSLIKKTGNL